MNYLNLLPDDLQIIIYKSVLNSAIHDTVNKAVNRYGNFKLRLGQMHKLILTDYQKRDLLDALYPDDQDDIDEDYLWEPDDDDE
jgi:hypothetical protein